MKNTELVFLKQTFSKMNSYPPIGQKFPEFRPRLQKKLCSDLPEALQKAWELAVFEAEANIKPCPYGGEYFTAGGRGGWHDMLFGQDTVACGLFALAIRQANFLF